MDGGAEAQSASSTSPGMSPGTPPRWFAPVSSALCLHLLLGSLLLGSGTWDGRTEACPGRSSRECGGKATAGRWTTGNVEWGGGTPGAPWTIPRSGRWAAGKTKTIKTWEMQLNRKRKSRSTRGSLSLSIQGIVAQKTGDVNVLMTSVIHYWRHQIATINFLQLWLQN